MKCCHLVQSFRPLCSILNYFLSFGAYLTENTLPVALYAAFRTVSSISASTSQGVSDSLSHSNYKRISDIVRYARMCKLISQTYTVKYPTALISVLGSSQKSRQNPYFMELEMSLPDSHESATGKGPEPLRNQLTTLNVITGFTRVRHW